MDKRTTDSRPETRDPRLPPAVCGLQSALCILAMLALLPAAGYAVTQTSDDAAGTSGEPSVTLSRSIEAGKAVSKQALSSKTKAANAETAKKAAATVSKDIAAVQKKQETPLVDKPLNPDEPEMVSKKLRGTVSARGANGIGVEYDKNTAKGSAKEMWFPFGAELELKGYDKTTDIQEGDKITVIYAIAKDKSRQMLKAIHFESHKPPEPVMKEVEESGEDKS